MTTPHSTRLLDDSRVPVRVTLAAAWGALVLLYAYVDIIAFYKPGVVDGILAGLVWEFDVSQQLLVAFLALMAVPILMIVLSITLPARASRMTNLVVAAAQIPYAAFNLVGEAWTVFYGLGFALELVVLVLILRNAWAWPRVTPTT